MSFDPIPSDQTVRALRLEVLAEPAGDATVLGVPVADTGDVPGVLGLDRSTLERWGFAGKKGQTLVVPRADDVPLVAVGTGSEVDAAVVRDAAGAFARAASRDALLAIDVRALLAAGLSAREVGQAVVEGAVLGRYRYDALRSKADSTALEGLTLLADEGEHAELSAGAERGKVLARATSIARDMSNAPGSLLTAPAFGELAERVGAQTGLEVEVFDKAALEEMGCGALLGVNRGSAEEPRLVRIAYRPEGATAHLGLVGKGIMYDSGGISLKPSDAMHAQMKNDMSGAAAILAAMGALDALGCRTSVTRYLMCTDNVPSGSATALGDVITYRNGTTVEILDTDAEGRVVMADGLILAAEEGHDAVVDIATLTGSAMRALGTEMSALFGNHPGLVAQVRAAAEESGERVWELPLHRPYLKDLESVTADMMNCAPIGKPDAIIAALFLEHFTAGVPWAHVDMAGPAQAGAPSGLLVPGCTGWGARLLAHLALGFAPVATGRAIA